MSNRQSLTLNYFEGHAGRPGLVGGSKKRQEESILFQSGIRSNGHPVYTVERMNADVLEKYRHIAVKIRGTNEGTVIIGDSSTGHSQMIQSVFPNDTVDDYVRFTVFHDKTNKDKLTIAGDVSYAGEFISMVESDDKNPEIRATNNLWQAFQRLQELGIPDNMPFEIYDGEKNYKANSAKNNTSVLIVE